MNKEMSRKPEVINEVKIVMPSFSANEGTSRRFAGAFVTQANPTLPELADIKCAVSEAVTNCIVHAYKNRIGNIYITMRLYSDRTFYIEIRDKGCGIPDIKKALEPLYTTDPDNERSGMGFSIMENFMDRMNVTSTEGRGTKVKMYKKLSPIYED